MISEDTLKLIQIRRNPVNSLGDLNKRLIGTREGFIFYTTNFRKDFDTKMAMLGRLEQENTQLKSVIKEIRECIEELYDNTDDTTCYDIDKHRKEYLLQILDKGEKQC